MAKKRTKKVKEAKPLRDMTATEAIESGDLVKRVTLEDRVAALEQRIDRIVNALDKSKSVRGL